MSILPNQFLAVVSYPELSKEDYEWITKFREKHDDFFQLIEPHFSLVFPITESWNPNKFFEEIVSKCTNQSKIKFQIRCAVTNNDRTSDYWHALLVPDEGFSHIVKLHDHLYSGKLSPWQRFDLDFTPHIGIGNSKDPITCKKMVDEVNAMDIVIAGTIAALDIVLYKKHAITTLQKIALGG